MSKASNLPSYVAIHVTLRKMYGPAKDHACSCGEPAVQWAYQFTAGDAELRSPDGGLPHSANPDDYKVMCRKCHLRFDLENDPVMVERMAVGTERGRAAIETHPDFIEQRREGGRRGGAAMAERMRTDPEFREQIVNGRRKRRRCSECGFTSTPGPVGVHQKSTGHSGYEEGNVS